MRPLNVITEELNLITQDIDELLNKEGFGSDEDLELHTELDKKAQTLETERDEALEHEERLKKQAKRKAAEASFHAGGQVDTGEAKETQQLINRVDLAAACYSSLFNGKKLEGAEAEMQQIADEEKERAEITSKGVYQDAERMVSIPQAFIKFGNMVPNGSGGHIKNPKGATVTVGTEGTDTVQTDIRNIIPALNIDPVLLRAGGQALTGLVGDQQWPLGSTLTMAWEAETDTEADATASFTNVSISPKRVGGKIPVSWKFMKQVPNAMAFFNGQLERHINITLDIAGFHGATNGPTGIESTTGVTDDSPASAAALTYAQAVSLKAAVKEASGDAMASAYFMPADVWEQAMTTPRTATYGDIMIINESSNTIAGSQFYVTEAITNDGTTDNNEAYLFYGDPSQNVFGFWGGVDLLADPYSSAASATTIIHSNLYCDHALLLGGTWSFDSKVLIS